MVLWGAVPSRSLPAEQSGGVMKTSPTILAADPIYSPDHPPLLVKAVTSWLAPGKDARLVLAYPLREAYLPQIGDLRQRLKEAGLSVVMEGMEMSRDDWAAEVEVRWSIWERSA